jgi:hypothetical protein
VIIPRRHFLSNAAGAGWIFLAGASAPEQPVIAVRRFGAAGNWDERSGQGSDDGSAIQSAIDFAARMGGGTVRLDSARVYKTSSDLIVKENVRLDLRGSTVVGRFDSGNHSVFRMRSRSELFGGKVKVVSTGQPGLQAAAHCGVSAGCRLGDPNEVARPDPDNDPHSFAIYDLLIQSDKWVPDGAGGHVGAPAIQIIGCSHYRIENITIPSSDRMYGAVHVDWGHIGPISTVDRAQAQTMNKRAYLDGMAYVIPSRHGIIRRIRAGALSAPSTGVDRGSFCVRISGAHSITVADCYAESVTYQAYAHEVGDLGAEFVLPQDRDLLGKRIRFENCRIGGSATGQVFELRGYADNIARAITDGYENMVDPLVECDVVFDGVTGTGQGAGARNAGGRVLQIRGGVIRNADLSRFRDGILVDERASDVRIENVACYDCEHEGILVHHPVYPPEDIVIENAHTYGNGRNAAFRDAAGIHLGTSRRCRIIRGRFGLRGLARDGTQEFAFRIGSGAVAAVVEEPLIHSRGKNGKISFIQRGDLTRL